MKRAASIFILISLLISGLLFTNRGWAKDDYSRNLLQKDQKKAQKLTEQYKVQEVLGPLAPVALSPFFGLTCLSGTSILCNKGFLPENDFLMGNEALNNGYVFAIFLALTIITSVPKLVTTSKIFAEMTDRLETYAGIISYAIILMMAQGGDSNQEVAVVYSAGVITLTKGSILAIAAAVNIFVINTVKYFFELLALISPIPTIDAIFEFTGKAIATGLAVIYAISPWLAFVLNLILFLICLVIFRWVSRRIKYLKAILLEPLLLKIRKKVFKRVDYDPDAHAKRRFADYLGGAKLVVKVFPNHRVGKIKKKDRCYLGLAEDKRTLIKPRLLNMPRILELDKNRLAGNVSEGILSYSIIVTSEEKQKGFELVFGKAYKEQIEAINAALARP